MLPFFSVHGMTTVLDVNISQVYTMWLLTPSTIIMISSMCSTRSYHSSLGPTNIVTVDTARPAGLAVIQLENIVEYLIKNSLAVSLQLSYWCAQSCFMEFCLTLNVPPLLADEQLLLFFQLNYHNASTIHLCDPIYRQYATFIFWRGFGTRWKAHWG